MDIEAAFECELDGEALTIQATQGVIVLNVETPEMARTLVAHFRRIGKLRATVARLTDGLLAISHRLELHVDEVVVASIGEGTDSGFLRLAGLQHVRLWPLRLLRRSSPK
jgi:hypothetical protein